MKHFFSLLYLSCLSLTAWAQFSVSGVNAIPVQQKPIDAVFVVENPMGGVLTYKDSVERNLSWFSYDLGATTATLLQEERGVKESSIALLDSTSVGYQLKIEGQPSQWVWVFNYEQLPLKWDSLQVISDVTDRCQNWQLALGYTAEPLAYDTLQHDQIPFEIPRKITLLYDSTFFMEGEYLRDRHIDTLTLAPDLMVPSPLFDTYYRVKGDLFAMTFGTADSIESDVIPAVAIENYPLAKVLVRENAKNEKDKDTSTPTKLSGSAPLNIEVVNQASPMAFFYDWCLSTDKEFASCQVQSAEKDFRFTFDQKGTYYLRSEITNASDSDDPLKNCLSQAVYVIEVLESSLDVPNIFTPNGDGVNDEFRVAYKSLVTFRGRIYNQWGRLVYEWKDPAKGWDGTIGGVPAAEGTYFCVIDATGSDKDENGNPVKYFHRGDVNLLR